MRCCASRLKPPSPSRACPEPEALLRLRPRATTASHQKFSSFCCFLFFFVLSEEIIRPCIFLSILISLVRPISSPRAIRAIRTGPAANLWSHPSLFRKFGRIRLHRPLWWPILARILLCSFFRANQVALLRPLDPSSSQFLAPLPLYDRPGLH